MYNNLSCRSSPQTILVVHPIMPCAFDAPEGGFPLLSDGHPFFVVTHSPWVDVRSGFLFSNRNSSIQGTKHTGDADTPPLDNTTAAAVCFVLQC